MLHSNFFLATGKKMDTDLDGRPWEELRRRLAEKDGKALEAALAELPPGIIARAILHLSPEEQEAALNLVGIEAAAEIIAHLPEEPAATLIERLETARAAEIVEGLDSAAQADVLGDIPEAEAEAILEELDPEKSDSIRRLIDYEDDTAGGLMATEVFKFSGSETVGDVLRRLSDADEDFERYRGQHPYIVSSSERLLGVVSLRRLLTSKRSEPLRGIMVESLSAHPSTSLDDLKDLFDEHPFLGLPVTDEQGRLVGVVSRESVASASLDRAEANSQKRQGIVNEELRSMPTLLRARRRLSWLTINIGLNILAASIIAIYEETLAAVIALAVFLPIVSDMSGCSGNQAVAVSMRELALGIAKPLDILYVWWKEASIGLINGAILGMLIAIAAYLWKGNPFLGLVVGTALALNTVIAVSIGGTVPLILKRFNVDPAVASGPMLTTITDMAGFFLVLSLATLMMPLLV